LLKEAAKHLNAIIFPSRFSMDMHYRKGFNIPMLHLPYFMPPTEIVSSTSKELDDRRPSEPSIPKAQMHVDLNDPYFLFVGRLEKLKGLQTLIPAFRRFNKAKLLIAGKGTYERALRELTGKTDQIQFLGHLAQSELAQLYRHAVAVIVPSLNFEVFPLVILESFQQNTPVIVRDIGGLAEIVEESGGGLVYNTEEDLLKAMEHLLLNQAFRDRLGHFAYQTYEKKLTPEVHLKQYLELIHEHSG
jgi:glycosyltransferase involved in cell wall biosynthesis